MNNFFKQIDRHFSYLALFTAALVAAMLPYYSDGSIILGGEGAYFLNFKVLQENLNYAWQNIGVGFPSTSLNFTYFNVLFYTLLEQLISDIQIINFIFIFVIYFLPFFAMFMVCRELQVKPFLSFLTAYFYLINPFSLYFLTSINQWNSLSLFILPFFFWIILKFYNHNGMLFLSFGLGSSLFAFTNANPPLMVINHISIFISLFFISLYCRPYFSMIELIKKYLVILSSFILFNLWWILNWISIMSDIPQIYTQNFALSWANLVNNFQNLIWKSFTLTPMIPVDPEENIFSSLYNSSLSFLVVLIPILIVLYYLYKYGFFNKAVCFLFSIMLVVIFLIKGPAEPFGFVYKLMMLHIPFFSIFKSPIEKWGVLYIFIFTLLMIVVLKDMKRDRSRKVIVSSFIAYLAFCSTPFITSNFIPDYKMGDGSRASRKYVDKIEYKNLRQEINNDPRDYRLLSLPGSLNYQVALDMDNDKFYTGMDPVLSNINKQFIAPYSVSLLANYDILYDNISKDNFSNLLSLYNIGKIVINKDMYPWFGFKEEENFQELETIFDKTMEGKKNEVISLYTNDNFLPHIYAAPESTLIFSDPKSLLPLTYTDRLNGYPALAFADQQDKNSLLSLGEILIANSSFNDSIIDLAKMEALSDSQQLKIDSQAPIFVRWHYIDDGNFEIKKDEIYNIWLGVNDELIGQIDAVEVGGEKYLLAEKDIKGKWLRLGSKKLKRGRHKITVNSRQKPIDRMVEVLILSEKKRKEYDGLLKSKDVSYLFYADKYKADENSKGLNNIRPYKNPYKLYAKQFYIPKDGAYLVKAYLKPKRIFIPARIAMSSISDISGNIRALSDAINDAVSGWKVSQKSTGVDEKMADVNIRPDGMYINAYFEKDIGFREEIILTKEFSDINLKENPYLIFRCIEDNQKVQEIHITVWLKNNKDEMFAKDITFIPDVPYHVMNLYEKARKIFKENIDNLSIGKVKIVFNKIEGIDAAHSDVKGRYKFIFKGLDFLEFKPILARFEDHLKNFSPDNYYYYGRGGHLKEAVFFEDIPQYVKRIYKLQKRNYIDLSDTSELALSFPEPDLKRGDNKLDFPEKFKVSMILDFDGDEKEDDIVKVLLPYSPKFLKGKIKPAELYMKIPVYQVYKAIKRRFPNKKRYYLLGLSIVHPEENSIHFWQRAADKRLYLYKEEPDKASGLSIGSNALKIDTKFFQLPEDYQKFEKDGHLIVKFDKVRLNKGEHKIDFFSNKEFTVDMVEIKAGGRKTPQIDSKKINPTRYIVDVNGAREPFTLVFSESFHKKWKAYISPARKQRSGDSSDESWSVLWSNWKNKDRRIELKKHFVVNSYANGWTVPVDHAAGEDFQIVLEYTPQRLFEVGGLISVTTLLASIVCLGYGAVRKEKV